MQQESNGIFNVLHSARISGGNSGGPLVFREGAREGVVFAINTYRISDASPVYVSISVAQMRQELEKDAGIVGLIWK